MRGTAVNGFAVALLGAGLLQGAATFSGDRALAHASALSALGPRPSGSPAHRKMQSYLRKELQARGCELTEDAFTASTPLGPVPMRNLLCRFAGSSGRVIALSGHYDTKIMPMVKFVGANDGGSSAALLLEMARALQNQPRRDDVVLVWFDGEEAVGEWSATDSLYGSRHLASRWQADGTLRRLRALINVDMVGDRDLGILQVSNSAPDLLRLVWRVASDLGHGEHFLNVGGYIEDDHMPFLNRGVAALDLIDFDYGPGNRYWHTDKDTPDKLAARSLQVVGEVLLETVRRLETQ